MNERTTKNKKVIKPRYKVGTISPGSKQHRLDKEKPANPNFRPEPLLPPDITFINSGLEIADYTVEGVEEGFSRYWQCVDDVMGEKPDCIQWGGFPLSPQLGRPRCLELIEQTRKYTGIPAGSDIEVTIAALKHLGARRIVIASRWADQLNQAIIRYFDHADIKVLAITTAGQMGTQAFAMSLDMGIRLVFQLSRQVMKMAPKAEALLLPGGTWHTLGCVPILEEDFGIPVVTQKTALTWQLIHDGIAPPVKGWSMLLENPSAGRAY